MFDVCFDFGSSDDTHAIEKAVHQYIQQRNIRGDLSGDWQNDILLSESVVGIGEKAHMAADGVVFDNECDANGFAACLRECSVDAFVRNQ